MTELSSDLSCEWDTEKRLTNIRKHGIDFQKITDIFKDENFLSTYDKINSTLEEDRYLGLGELCALGSLNGIVLFISFTIRNNRYRIISCRNATPKEKEVYYGHIRKTH